jgi:type I restriction enzyme M protein
LTDKAKEKIESLTDAEIFNLLVYKWIMPVVNGVNSTCDSSVDTFIKGLVSLKNKYSNNLSEINAEIHKADAELFALMDELVGSETDMLAVQMLKDALK